MSAVDYKISDYDGFCKKNVIEGFTMLVAFEDRAEKLKEELRKRN